MNRFLAKILFLVVIAALSARPAGAQTTPEPKIVGQWLFAFKGEKRHFQFNKDSTYIGHYPISGRLFRGTWRLDGTKVVLLRDGQPGEWGSITFRMADEARLMTEGHELTAQRMKP